MNSKLVIGDCKESKRIMSEWKNRRDDTDVFFEQKVMQISRGSAKSVPPVKAVNVFLILSILPLHLQSGKNFGT